MLDVLEFTFSDWIHFGGTLLLLSVVAEGVGGIFRRE